MLRWFVFYRKRHCTNMFLRKNQGTVNDIMKRIFRNFCERCWKNKQKITIIHKKRKFLTFHLTKKYGGGYNRGKGIRYLD